MNTRIILLAAACFFAADTAIAQEKQVSPETSSAAVVPAAPAIEMPQVPTMWGGMLIDIDKDKDNAITLDEYLARPASAFKDMDKNGDGKLTQEEIDTHYNELPAGPAGPFIAQQKLLAESEAAAKNLKTPTIGEGLITSLDKNKDGSVTLEEYLVPPTESFKSMDKDGNGKLVQQEVDSYYEELTSGKTHPTALGTVAPTRQ